MGWVLQCGPPTKRNNTQNELAFQKAAEFVCEGALRPICLAIFESETRAKDHGIGFLGTPTEGKVRVHYGGLEWTVGGTVFEMWLGL